MTECNDDCSKYITFVDELDSTNNFLSQICDRKKVDEYTTVAARYQTKGKGQIGNKWESERGKNLTFSTVIYPKSIFARDQFIISMVTSTVICDALNKYISDISIKWPNDIYWRDKKICGMLIENDLQGVYVDRSVLGIGININQKKFFSDAPNPVSLFQIIKTEIDLCGLLKDIIARLKYAFDKIGQNDSLFSDSVYSKYKKYLYRRDGMYLFNDKDGDFLASIHDVLLDGHLILKDSNNKLRSYIFKEVKFILS